MLRPKYKYRNLKKRIKLNYYRIRPDTKYFFSFHNEWLDSRLQIFWDSFYANFSYDWSLVFRRKQPVKFPDDKRSFFIVDPFYSEEPFDNSKVFVDSVPFDDDEFGENVYDPDDYFFNDSGFELDDFFLDNVFLFVIFTFIFFPVFFPFIFFFWILFIVIALEQFFIYDDVDTEDEDWEINDDEEDDEDSFERSFIFPHYMWGEFDNEFSWSTDFYFYVEFVFLDFFTFDEFFVLGRSWAHKPLYKKFLKIFKF